MTPFFDMLFYFDDVTGGLAGAVLGIWRSTDHVAGDGGDGAVQLAVGNPGRGVVSEGLALRVDLASQLTLVRGQTVKMLQDVALVLAVALDEFLK